MNRLSMAVFKVCRCYVVCAGIAYVTFGIQTFGRHASSVSPRHAIEINSHIVEVKIIVIAICQ